MAIGNDELDDFEGTMQEETTENDSFENEVDEEIDQQSTEEPADLLTSLLQSKGIEDKSKIKFENDEGEIEEKNWEDLSKEEQLNILSTEEDHTPQLDDSEIELLNAIRNSGLTPAEYLNYIANNEVQRYVQNAQEPSYEIDQYSDDELYLMDLMSKMGDVTEDEAMDALEKAKSNETLYQKQIAAIRNEYKKAEEENRMQAQLEQDQLAQQQYAQFSDQIVDEINGLKDIQGFDLNMSEDDMQTLYDFITQSDAAGNNYFAKALSDPKTLVKTAWLALNGDQMIEDITNYFQKEISSVRKESYKKGVADTQKKMNQIDVIFKSSPKNKEYYDDMDSF